MKSLRKWFRKGVAGTPQRKFPRLAVEELEDRTVLSLTPLNVATAIINSPEALTNFVAKEYQTFLNRAPDATGLAGWVNQLEQGLSFEQVDAAFASSAEYLQDHGGTPGTTWLTALYHDFLGRTPSSTELNGWLKALAGGITPYQVAYGFATSLERDALVITQDYQQFLGRLPESGALSLWEGRLQQGLTQAGMEAAILASPEFYLDSGGTDQGFLTAIYQDVLGRTPASAEVDSWLVSMGDGTPLINLHLNPLDINLLGLEVQTNAIQVTISALPGQGELLGNLLTDVSNLLNLQGVNNALDTVLGSVVNLLNSSSLSVSGVGSGAFSSATAATTPVLDLFVAPVHLNLLGAVVDTSPIHLTITAHSGNGLVLGNVIADLANLFNPPLPSTLNLDTINAALQNLLNELNAQIPGIGSAPTTTPPTPVSGSQILALTVPPIDVNLLGLILQTSQIQVNANALTGNGELLGNVLTTLLNTLGATPQSLSTLNSNLNALLAKVIGVLNASTLTLPANALSTLSQVLQTLALPNLINATGSATAPILNLIIASSNGTTPPVNVNLLGLQITTSNIQAQLLAQTGNGEVLGNLLYNVANLLNPGSPASLLTILNELGV